MANRKLQMLKALRVQHDITQRDMAKRLGLAPNSYNHKENGKQQFSQNEIDKILSMFNKSYEEIFLPEGYAQVEQ